MLIDETAKQLTALKILAETLDKRKQVLRYIYEEYIVSYVR